MIAVPQLFLRERVTEIMADEEPESDSSVVRDLVSSEGSDLQAPLFEISSCDGDRSDSERHACVGGDLSATRFEDSLAPKFLSLRAHLRLCESRVK